MWFKNSISNHLENLKFRFIFLQGKATDEVLLSAEEELINHFANFPSQYDGKVFRFSDDTCGGDWGEAERMFGIKIQLNRMTCVFLKPHKTPRIVTCRMWRTKNDNVNTIF